MGETRINEVNIKGNVKDNSASKPSTESTTAMPGAEREKLIQECLERMKAYLKYEHNR